MSMKKEVKTLRNKSKESMLVRINGIQKEIKAGETFETPKFKELLRMYGAKFELVDTKKAEVKKVEQPTEKKSKKK